MLHEEIAEDSVVVDEYQSSSQLNLTLSSQQANKLASDCFLLACQLACCFAHRLSPIAYCPLFALFFCSLIVAVSCQLVGLSACQLAGCIIAHCL